MLCQLMTSNDLQGHSAIAVWKEVLLIFASPGDLTTNDIADDLEWPLKKVIYIRCLYLKNTAYNVRS